MLQVKNLNITHTKDLRDIITDFNLTLNKGDKAAIIGEEGNGKSTLIKWIYDSNLIDSYCVASGEKVINDEVLAYLPQELPDSNKTQTIYEFLTDEEEFWNKSPNELGKLASDFNLDVASLYSEQVMNTLSGGEKIKYQLIKLLLVNPTVLLLDEPSNDIDMKTLQWLESLINSWNGIVVYISHDETLIENTANVIVHIEQISRKTQNRYSVAHTTYNEYITRRDAQYNKQEQEAANDLREKKIRDEKLRRISDKVENSLLGVSRQDPHKGAVLKKHMAAVKSMEKRFQKEDEDMTKRPQREEAIFFTLGDNSVPAGKNVIELCIDKLYTPQKDRILSKNINLTIRGSEKICIVGDNGAGKTTLIKEIENRLLSREDLKVVYMPQNYEEDLNLDVTPVEFLTQTGDKEEITKIRTYLGSLKYTVDEMNHPMRELSGGQKAKVFLLKMSLERANVLILDEPTRNFSPLSGPVIREMLKQYKGAIISISHDRKYIDEVCDKIYMLNNDGLVLTEREAVVY